jgi:hypothetical protein
MEDKLKELVKAIIKEAYSHVPEAMQFFLDDLELRFSKHIPHEGNLRNVLETHGEESLSRFLVSNLTYSWIKPQDSFKINSPDFKYHGQVAVVTKKRNQQIYAYIKDQPSQGIRVSMRSVLLMEQVRTNTVLNVKVGDIVCIKDNNFRPRYEEDSLFKIVWKGNKYVRVEPRFPKYPTHTNARSFKRPGDNVYEMVTDPKTGKISYFYSCYSKDIPITQLIAPLEQGYDGEDMETVIDLDSLGF